MPDTGTTADAAAVEAFWNSRYGWTCATCGGRGLLWGFAGEGEPTRAKVVTMASRAHAGRYPGCRGVMHVGLAVELDPSMVAAVRAAGVQLGPVVAEGAENLESLRAVFGDKRADSGGPWATPDIFRGR